VNHKKIILIIFAALVLNLSGSFSVVFAQSIPITISESMENVVFDGKWTFYSEWKASSLVEFQNNNGSAYIRSAHQGNFIYVMLDVVSDSTIDTNQDFAMICFDTQSDQSTSPDENDYCFKTFLASTRARTLQGSATSNNFIIIDNPSGLVALGNSSDENDRYSKNPHASYEFRIPVDFVGRTDHYGFYLEIFDYSKNTRHFWPPSVTIEDDEKIASPSLWGVLYSPDKSLPEYEIPLLVFFFAVFGSLFASYKIRAKNFGFNYFSK